ncbi:hypothetical protein [Pseudomonas sp. S36]|uniref:hypothetical protein n=1 Tax=Pseudomonas sp. S36 TaxID=2767447 RepID=UPI0019114494|nr:hypothetical protein [Pseudomonas sp. S36]
MGTKLAILAKGIVTLRATLAEQWHNNALLGFTEFDSIACHNGSGGTDHCGVGELWAVTRGVACLGAALIETPIVQRFSGTARLAVCPAILIVSPNASPITDVLRHAGLGQGAPSR